MALGGQTGSSICAKQAVADIRRGVYYYDPKLLLLLCCDESPYGIGVVLAHWLQSGEEKPVAFASRQLIAVEKNHSQLGKEVLAVVLGAL